MIFRYALILQIVTTNNIKGSSEVIIKDTPYLKRKTIRQFKISSVSKTKLTAFVLKQTTQMKVFPEMLEKKTVPLKHKQYFILNAD